MFLSSLNDQMSSLLISLLSWRENVYQSFSTRFVKLKVGRNACKKDYLASPVCISSIRLFVYV